jgi:hypothetical protein
MTLVLLSLSRAVFTAAYKSARAGDKAAARQTDELWADYDNTDLDCFLCGGVTLKRPHTQVLPERDTAAKVIAVPLCQGCAALPGQLKLHRALQILKKMWSTPKKQMHFTMTR